MPIFNIIDKQVAFESHVSAIENLISAIDPVAEQSDIRQLELLKNNFIRKTDDFFSENRKLNIGVIGQVKAGKSSFLNSMLFDGQAVLPKASTPKTATLTKIEYSPVNKIEIEYYSMDEWAVLEDNAHIDLEDEIYVASRELVKMVKQTGINAREWLSKGKEIIEFESYDALIGKLNDFVGENGKYTALVKAVVLYLDREELKEISIVDTPGLNDPIISRTIRTKEFIEVCDVVFFLSQATSFLDKSDWALLSTQLPQKGSKQLVLIASKYDSAIRDILRQKEVGDDVFDNPINNENETDSIPEAKKKTTQKLNDRAKNQVMLYVQDLKRRDATSELIGIISGCEKPILISSMVYNMSNKSVSDFDKEEMNVFNALNAFSESIDEDIRVIGDFSEVKLVFNASVAKKEELLSQKSSSFIPTSIEEIRIVLSDMKEREEKRLAILTGNELEQVAAQKKESESQINSIKSEVVNVVSEVSVNVETKKIATIQELRKRSTEYSYIKDKSATKTVSENYTVSDSSWYNPFSWGKSHTEYYTYQQSYSYLDVSDALDNIHRFTNDVVSRLEAIFIETANLTAMKRKLLGVIVNNFDTANENYDASFFKLLTEKTLNGIEFPIIKLDFTDRQNEISSKFSGEITSSNDKTSLNQMLSQAISKIFDQVANLVEDEVRSFKFKLEGISEKLLSELLKNIEDEFNEICKQFNDKENQIKRIKIYAACINEQIQKL
jgi:DNA-binding protein Fis